MRNVLRFAAVMILIIAMAMTFTACNKSGGTGGNGGSGETTEDSKPLQKGEYHTEDAYVRGKCFVLAGMSSEDEEFDEDLIKEMFDIDDVAKYMGIYFEKSGKAYVSSLLYDDVEEGKWAERDEITELEVDEDYFEFKKESSGMISTVKVEEDGEEFYLTFREADKVPDELAKYME